MTNTVTEKIKFYDIKQDKNIIIKEIDDSKIDYNKNGGISIENSYKKTLGFINNL